MFNYKPIIEMVWGQMQTEYDGAVMKAIQKCDVVVDKERLIAALKFDRQQYEHGYHDAMEHNFASAIIDGEGYERCSGCGEHETGLRYFRFCPHCGCQLKGDIPCEPLSK